MHLEAHRSTLNANSFLPDLSSQLHSFTSWVSRLRPTADQILHTTSKADPRLPLFPRNGFVRSGLVSKDGSSTFAPSQFTYHSIGPGALLLIL